MGPSRGCNGVPAMLQRRPRQNVIAAPRQSKEGLTGPLPDPTQGEGELTPFVSD